MFQDKAKKDSSVAVYNYKRITAKTKQNYKKVMCLWQVQQELVKH